MAGLGWLRTGTITVTNGSKAVTGTDTIWGGGVVNPGDIILLPNGALGEVESVGSNTALMLKQAYAGATASAQPYAIIRMLPSGNVAADLAAALQALIQRYGITLDQLMEWLDSAGAGSFTAGTTTLVGLHGLRKLMADVAAAWSPGRQGPGSGMDADTVDGCHASELAKVQLLGGQDMNLYTAPGLYEYDPVSLNSPTAAPNFRVLAMGREIRATQMAFQYDEDRVFFRRRLDSGWKPWRELLHTGTQGPTLNGPVAIESTGGAALNFKGGTTGRRVQLFDLNLSPAAHIGSGVDMGGGPYEHSLYYPAAAGGSLKIGSYDGSVFSEQLRIGDGAVRAAGPLKPGQYTLATLPSASSYNGCTITVSNASGGPALCLSDGSSWINIRTNAPVN